MFEERKFSFVGCVDCHEKREARKAMALRLYLNSLVAQIEGTKIPPMTVMTISITKTAEFQMPVTPVFPDAVTIQSPDGQGSVKTSKSVS